MFDIPFEIGNKVSFQFGVEFCTGNIVSFISPLRAEILVTEIRVGEESDNNVNKMYEVDCKDLVKWDEEA